MKHLLIATSKPEHFSRLTTHFNEGAVEWATSVDEVLQAVSTATPDLMIIDEELDGQPGLALAREIIKKNAMVNQVVVSRLSPEDFHDASEGLGILAQLSPEPDEKRAAEIIGKIKKIVQNF
jgi:DNA-binding response OmpR family regulator